MTDQRVQDLAVTGDDAAVPARPRRRTTRVPSVRALPVAAAQVRGAPRPVPFPGSTPHVRSCALLLINEDLARARMREMERSAEDIRRAYRLVAARRWRRRASNASRRARMAQNAIW